MKKILIAGADSYVGKALEQYLQRRPEEYSVDTVDTREDAWKNAEFSSYDCVFHVAGIAHVDIGKLSEDEKKIYYKVNTNLALDVAKTAKDKGVKQFIFMSSSIVYGKNGAIGKEKVIAKDTPVQIVNFYGDSKRKAEIGLEKLRDPEFKVVILRCPMIYGKNSKGNYRVLSGMVKKYPFFPKVENKRSMLYIGNLVEFVRLMVQNKEDGIFCPCDKEEVCTSELAKMIAQAQGKKIVLVPGMKWILKLLSLASEKVNKAFGNFLYSDEVSSYKEEYRLFSLNEAVRETEID